MGDERREFKRLQTPVLCRPLGVTLVHSEAAKRSVQDISLGGLCVFTDDKHQKGERLELELFLPDGNTFTIETEVVWVDTLAKGAPARFEVGLRYIEPSPTDLARLQGLLKDPN
jgi:hypothetical protein